MDAKRAEHLMNVARAEQHKALLRWRGKNASSRESTREAARLDCAEWAKAGDELYRILEKQCERQAS